MLQRKFAGVVHLIVSAATIAIFVFTGQLMRHHTPPMSTLSDSTRLLYRSRHIYILAAGLVNLMLALYFQAQAPSWRRIVQRIGSGALVISAVLLPVAFFVETKAGFRAEMAWSSAGLYFLAFGCLLHTMSALRTTRRS